jgi:outer membrane immunogenic protein
MNMYRFLALPLALTASSLIPVVAHADAADWAGTYIGLHAGYAMNNDIELEPAGGTASDSFDMTGYVAGGQIGYNWAPGGMVLGVEADAAAADVNGDAPCANPAASCGAKMDQLFSIQGHAGIPLNKFLLYGSAGVAYAQLKATVKSPGGGDNSDSNFQTGWLVGLGGSMLFNNHWNGLIEVQYADFGSNDYTLAGSTVSVDSKFVILKAGANWTF